MAKILITGAEIYWYKLDDELAFKGHDVWTSDIYRVNTPNI